MMNIIVTGATSLIGTAVIREYINENINIYAVVRPNSTNINELPKSELVKIIECELSDISKLQVLINEECDIFFHIGWLGTSKEERNNFDIQFENIGISLKALKVAKALKCKRFIATGSQAEYGPYSGVLSPDTSTNPKSAYGTCKLSSYYCIKQLANEINIDFMWVRVFSVYGPNDNKVTLITSMVKSLLRNEIPKLTKCEQIWDFLYVEDAARALKLVAQKGKDNSIYCLGSGHATTLKDYVIQIYNECNSKGSLIFGELEYEKNQVMHLEADITQLCEDTGFCPKYTFEQGIKKTVDWIIEKEK